MDSLLALIAHITGRQVVDMGDSEGIRARCTTREILVRQFPNLAENWQERRDELQWELLGAEMPECPVSVVIKDFVARFYGQHPHEVVVIGK